MKCRLVFALLMVVGPWAVCGAEEPAPEGRYTGVALGVMGELNAADAERVRSFVEINTSVSVRMSEIDMVQADSLGEIADAAAGARAVEDACLVILYVGDQVFEEHSVYRYASGIGIVNVSFLKLDDHERFLRRIEKLTMRSIGLLLDVPMVPNPQSAMWSYRTLEELDAMGRNFDPPSLVRLQENVKALGIPLLEDSPYLLLRDE